MDIVTTFKVLFYINIYIIYIIDIIYILLNNSIYNLVTWKFWWTYLDEYGNIVAVAVAKLSLKKILKDYGVIPENTNFGVKASAVRNLMEGNAVPFKSPNTVVVSMQELNKNVTDGTVHITCWMTTAQIEQMRAKKVLFEA